MRKIQIDVRQFAVPCPMLGSIETHSGYGSPPLNGQELHQIVQRRRVRDNENYTPEKNLSYIFIKPPYEFIVSGRADGFLKKPAWIEEIKSAFDIEELELKLISQPDHPYMWQLKTYGYFYYKLTGEIPRLTLHLISSRTFRGRDLEVKLNIEDYERWLERRLEKLFIETKVKEKVFKKRQKIAAEMKFPFPAPRPGQKELVETVETHFNQGTPLLLQAPTGLGKTAGILFPALKEALARGQKVIYVTPKNSQHSVAEEAVEKIREQGCSIRSLTITAKSKMCLKAEPLCNPKYCEYAKDHYQKVEENKLIDQLSKIRKITRKKLKALGEEYQVCPFALSIDSIERADVVIGDYNYVFAPRSLLGCLTESLLEKKERPNLIVDEAHNLPSRSQDYFSPSISVQQLQKIERFLPQLPRAYAIQAQALTIKARDLIQSYGKEGPSQIIDMDLEPFAELDQDIRNLTMQYLDSGIEVQTQDPLLRLMNLWSDFVNSITLKGEEFFQTYQRNNTTEMLKITCCDASEHLRLAYKEFKNVVAFSATLKPFEYYQELLGFSEQKTQKLEFSSPFSKARRKILIIPQISTKFSERTSNAHKIAETISRITSLQRGNYLALFPSFEFLRMVQKLLNLPDMQILTQEREMKQAQIEEFFALLKGSHPTLLLGVQGGVFSEGVDFPGDMLIGAFIIGPALPSFDFEREQIKSYYENHYGKENAFNYAYVYPAMAKAIQSAGRVIRSETDRGVIVMMDSRFLQSSYSATMPEGWFEKSPQELVSKQILQDLERFWEEVPHEP
ncbi:MAG: helicase C-terminal domain-containing protein [Pseudobdellovibrionaceae bacterium]